jgi:hypothetical protein
MSAAATATTRTEANIGRSRRSRSKGETTVSESSEITTNNGDDTRLRLSLPSWISDIQNDQCSESQEENDMNPNQSEPNIYWEY